MQVRPTERGDLDGVREIMNWAIERTPTNFNLEPVTLESLTDTWRTVHETYPWYVAELQDCAYGRIVGFANAYQYKPREAYRLTAEAAVYVHPDHHGGGIGRALYRALIDATTQRGFHTLIASITLPNPVSERLHTSFDFHRVGTITHAGFKFGLWHDIALWQLMLG